MTLHFRNPFWKQQQSSATLIDNGLLLFAYLLFPVINTCESPKTALLPLVALVCKWAKCVYVYCKTNNFKNSNESKIYYM